MTTNEVGAVPLPECNRRWRVRDNSPALKPSPAHYGVISPPSAIYCPILFTNGNFGGEIIPILELQKAIEKLDELFELKPYIYIIWVGGTVIENIVPVPVPGPTPPLPILPEGEVE